MNNEQLSALMDDELAAQASRDAVAQLLADADSRATWGRYHLVGAALRGAPATFARPPDNLIIFPGAASRTAWGVGLGLAAAAALAAVALLLSPHLRPASSPLDLVAAPVAQRDGENIAMTASTEAANLSQDATTLVNQTIIVRGDEAQQRINSYVTDFNEQRARQRTPGVHPYVRIVGFETH